MAEHGVKVEVSNSTRVHSAAGLSHTTLVATSTYAETTCNNTCERLVAAHGTPAFYEKLGSEEAGAPRAAGMCRRI